MSTSPNARAVSDQFQRTLKMLRAAITAFPAGEWRTGEPAYLRPAGIAYHVLETIDYYAGDQPADLFPWGGRFGVGWEESESAKLPSQEQLIAYLDEVEAKLAGWFAATDLLSPEQVFPYTGPTALDRAIYTLRHTQHHVGELNLELTRRGFQGPDWR